MLHLNLANDMHSINNILWELQLFEGLLGKVCAWKLLAYRILTHLNVHCVVRCLYGYVIMLFALVSFEMWLPLNMCAV